ncbi:hypothetical protein R6Z07F_004604 [Ovis aries]
MGQDQSVCTTISLAGYQAGGKDLVCWNILSGQMGTSGDDETRVTGEATGVNLGPTDSGKASQGPTSRPPARALQTSDELAADWVLLPSPDILHEPPSPHLCPAYPPFPLPRPCHSNMLVWADFGASSEPQRQQEGLGSDILSAFPATRRRRSEELSRRPRKRVSDMSP